MEEIKHSSEKQRIPFEMMLNDVNIVTTKNYGKLTQMELYKGYFYPMLIDSKLKAIFNHLPYKITFEIDKDKLEGMEDLKKQFYLDSVERKALDKGFTQEEMDIFRMATRDMIYSL